MMRRFAILLTPRGSNAFSGFLATLLFALGTTNLLSWYFNPLAFIQLQHSSHLMTPNAAFILILFSISLFCHRQKKFSTSSLVSLLAVIFSFVILSQFFLKNSLGADYIFPKIFDQAHISLYSEDILRVRFISCVSFILTGIGFIYLNFCQIKKKALTYLSEVGAILIALPVISYINYLVGISTLDGYSKLTTMSLQAALSISTMGIFFVIKTYEKYEANPLSKNSRLQKISTHGTIIIGTIIFGLAQGIYLNENKTIAAHLNSNLKLISQAVKDELELNEPLDSILSQIQASLEPGLVLEIQPEDKRSNIKIDYFSASQKIQVKDSTVYVVLQATPYFLKLNRSVFIWILLTVGAAFLAAFWYYSKALVRTQVQSEELECERRKLTSMNQKLAVIQKIDAILAVSKTKENLINYLLKHLAIMLHSKVALYWEFDTKDGTLKQKKYYLSNEIFEIFIEDTKSFFFKPGEGLPGRVYQSKIAEKINNVSHENNFPRKPAAHKANLEHTFAIPIVHNTETIGVLEFLSDSTSEAISDEFLKDLTMSGKRVGDVLARFKTESELKIARANVDQLYSAIEKSAIMSVTDASGKIIFANEEFEKISKYGIEELLGAQHNIVKSDYHDREFFKNMWTTIASGKTWSGEVQNKNKFGEPYWVYSTISPLRSPDGKIDKYVSIRFDITQKKKLEASSAQSTNLASLGEMAGGIAHEINNPLAIIVGKVALLRNNLVKENVTNPKLFDLTQSIELTAQRIAKIVKGLRTFSRDAENDPLVPESLTTIVNDTLELCQSKFKDHSVTLENKFILPPEIQVECRSVQIGQVILNLLNNAFDEAKNHKNGWVRIEGEIEASTQQIIIRVIDSGSGIPETIRKKMFQPFFTTKEVGKGTGLGLAICKGIIEHHNGTIAIDDSSPNTCFKIVLPIYSSDVIRKAS